LVFTVARQILLFLLFMLTLEDITTVAKPTSGFECSAEDIKATSIEISKERVLAVDQSCSTKTKLTTLILDHGISFSSVCDTPFVEASKEQGDVISNLNAEERVLAEEDDSCFEAHIGG
jgi:hypothetical protein